MATVISIALQKGGVGKTTTAVSLAATLGFRHKRVLLVDLDYQANATDASDTDCQYTIFDVITSDLDTSAAIVKCRRYDLLGADEKISVIERMENMDRNIVSDMLKPLLHNYDYIIIDTPPALGNLLECALMASDYVVIPADPRSFSLQGVDKIQFTIEDVQKANKKLKVLGLLLVKYSNRTNLNKQMKDALEVKAKELNTTIFTATIREAIVVPESQAMREPLIDYAPNSKPNIDYKAFTTELLQRLGDI